MNSKTSNNKKPTSPNSYINVNSKHNGDFGSVIVLFNWSLLVPTIAASYEEKEKGGVRNPYSTKNIKSKDIVGGFVKESSTENEFKNAFEENLTSYFRKNKLFKYKTLDENLNSLANRSLLSIRTTVGDKIGTGRATITLENFDNQWLFQGTNEKFNDIYMKPIFLNGLYVTIDVRGRYDTSRYYRIFTGSVTSSTYTDNPVDRKVTLELKDLSKLISNSRYNVHPSFWESDFTAIPGKVSIESNNLQNKTNIEIAKIIIPNIKDKRWENPTDKYSMAAFEEMWQYPELSVVEMQTDIGFTDVVYRNYRKSYTTPSYDINSVNASSPLALVWGDSAVDNTTKEFSVSKPHSVYAINLRISKLMVSEFKTRTEILNEAAMLSFFSSYIDGSGNIHFHPPRYDYVNINNNSMPILPIMVEGGNESGVIENPYIYVIDDDESITESYNTSEDEVVTCLKVQGEVGLGFATGDTGGIRSINPTYKRPNVFWEDGGRRYGFRERKISIAAFEDDKGLKAFALSAFMRLFLEIDKMSVTIPLRPELEVDRPIFLPDKKKIYHIKSISHSYTAGGDKSPGDFTTSLECYAGRPVKHSSLITTNIFRNVDPDQLLNTYRSKGFKLKLDMLNFANKK